MEGILMNMLEVLLVELAGVAVLTGVLYAYWKTMTAKNR